MKAAKKSKKTKGETRNILVVAFYCLAFICCFFCGCDRDLVNATKFHVLPEGVPSYEQITACYTQTRLKTSTSADVLSVIRAESINFSEFGLLSQSKSVIALSGQKKDGYKIWFSMVAFDERAGKDSEESSSSPDYDLTAKRKYMFIVDERPRFMLVTPWEALKFDCEMVLGAEVLDEPYANENARRIAILRHVQTNARKDMDQVRSDNNALDVSGGLVNQAFEAALAKLDSSPVLATRLDSPDYFEFEHNSFDKGKIKMTFAGDVVTIKIRLGSLAKRTTPRNRTRWDMQ